MGVRMLLSIFGEAKTIRGMRWSFLKLRPYVVGFTLVGIAPLAVAFVPGYRPQDFLGHYWVAGLEHLPDAEVLPRLRQIASLSDDQIPVVVQSLASQRRAQTSAARTVITEQLGQWKLLPIAKSSRRVRRLAVELSAAVPELSDRNREFAAEVAQRLLDWPIEHDAGATVEMFVCCERILRAAPVASRSLRRDRMAAKSAERWNADGRAADGSGLDVGNSAEGELPTVVPAESSPPLVPLTNDEALQWKAPQVAAISGAGRRKGGFRLSDSDESTSSVEESSSLDGAEDVGSDADSERSDSMRREGDGSDVDATSASQPALEAPETETPESNVSDRALMVQLRAEDLKLASAAVRQLRGRGFRDREFGLALRLTDPDQRVRLDLIEQLPDLVGIDPVPWLIWLSEDESPEVRRAVVAVMATSAEPRLRARLRTMEVEDADADVVRLARQAKSANGLK